MLNIIAMQNLDVLFEHTEGTGLVKVLYFQQVEEIKKKEKTKTNDDLKLMVCFSMPICLG